MQSLFLFSVIIFKHEIQLLHYNIVKYNKKKRKIRSNLKFDMEN
jgi:hypothetical protein